MLYHTVSKSDKSVVTTAFGEGAIIHPGRKEEKGLSHSLLSSLPPVSWHTNIFKYIPVKLTHKAATVTLKQLCRSLLPSQSFLITETTPKHTAIGPLQA